MNLEKNVSPVSYKNYASPVREGVLNQIGNTPLVEISRKMGPKKRARVFAKMEMFNPTGSMKDRMALAIVEEAEKKGILKRGCTLVEYSSGSTGTSLAQVCAVKDYKIKIVTSNAFSIEKINHMKAMGAELVMIQSDDGGINKKLFTEMIDMARAMSLEPDTYWPDQMNNYDMLEGYKKLGQEIWEQTKGNLKTFVHCVGTCGSLKGVSTEIRKYNKNINIVAVEPKESAVLSGGKPGSHSIEGMGAGYVVQHWNDGLADSIQQVSTKEAITMARKLSEIEAIFAGPSSGANLVAAFDVAAKLPENAVVVTIFPDSGFKYLSTPLYNLQLEEF
ncbi:MAG: cysteine synthase family protein [Halomonas sp.]|nr:cysteine synthase family protein [Halomonas sp.]TVP49305.1 MAG: cysteine synthase family protein [Halomonas sp.]